MTAPSAASTFHRFSTRPVINACGIYTDLGGIVFSPRVQRAMEAVGGAFVRMTELLDRSGEMIAGLMEAEAARVTTGASGAIALGTAACIAGMDGEVWERLPETGGLKNDVLIHQAHRYKYDRMVRLAGGRLREYSGGKESLAAALQPQTAMIMFPAHLAGGGGSASLRETCTLARQRGVPVLVDAAYLNDPPSRMRSFTAAGADLVCFSAKYFWGPNSGGFVCGRRDLIAAVAGLDFTRYESGRYLTFGRPFKLDRHTIVATVVALEEWMEMDHEERWQGYGRKVAAMREQLGGIAGIETAARCFTLEERLEAAPVNCMTISFAGGLSSADALGAQLAAGDPDIATVIMDGKLVIAVDTLLGDQHRFVASRVRQLLEAGVSARP